MKYWQQQWNFALWCATTGRGISRDILSGMQLRVKLRVFFSVSRLFHGKKNFLRDGKHPKREGTRRSIKRTSNMTFHRTREFLLSLEWSHQQISALCTAHTMVLAMFLFMFPDMVLYPQAWTIPAHMQNLTVKGAELIRETWSLLSEMSEHRPSF